MRRRRGRDFRFTLHPGDRALEGSYSGHEYVVTGDHGACLVRVIVDDEPSTLRLGRALGSSS